jgi:hypothetical protein
MSTVDEDKTYTYKSMIDLIFYAAIDASFNIPQEYRLDLMKGVVYFATEKLNGCEEHENIIYAAFKKWTGEDYEDSDEEEDDE